MLNFRLLVVVSSLCLAIVSPNTALGWGNEGHQIVCAIAYKLLPGDKQRALTQRTRDYRPPSGESYRFFTHACTFADRARANARQDREGWAQFGRFSHWHFLNVNRRTRSIDPELTCDDCILKGLEYHLQRSQNANLPEWRRTESLFFLGHWVGDIHQPLHVSFRDDLGGNSIDRIQGGFYRNSHLHQVWDSGIISKGRENQDWWSYALDLVEDIETRDDAEIASWRNDDYNAWAAESYAITISDKVDYCRWQRNRCVSEGRVRTLDEDYQREFVDVVNERLMRAGVRLAYLLNGVL